MSTKYNKTISINYYIHPKVQNSDNLLFELLQSLWGGGVPQVVEMPYTRRDVV